MPTVARRFAIAAASFVLAWLAATLLAGWVFGSGNMLVWVFATLVGISTYLALARQEQRAGQRGIR